VFGPVIIPAFVTLDGVMQAPGGPEEDPTGGFAHGGRAVNHWDEAMYAAMGETLSKPFDLLLGARRMRSSPRAGPTSASATLGAALPAISTIPPPRR
jgi:hypothetical protein